MAARPASRSCPASGVRPAGRGRCAADRNRSVAGRALLATLDDPHDPPRWLVRLAADHGHDVRGHRWSIAAPGVYDSQKVLVYLTPPGGAAPAWIVKITRDARHAARLQNEAKALGILAGYGPIDGMTVPGLVGPGDAGRLAAVIETIVPGRPFEPVLRGPDGLDRLRPALEALGGLAERSAHPVAAAAVAATFGRLLDQYVEIHRPTDEDRTRLAALVERVAAWPTPIPLVAMHGDPGTWNLMARSGRPGRVPGLGVVRPRRAAALGSVPPAARGGGRRRADADPPPAHVDPGRARPRRGAVQRAASWTRSGDYRERIGVAAELVEPLFTFCWVHRALKESARRRPDDVARGHYARFARRIVASPTAPTLRRLYGEGASP